MGKALTITSEELGALRSYAAEFGRTWKRSLDLDWQAARARPCHDLPDRGAILHGLRNSHGPRWLRAFQFPDIGDPACYGVADHMDQMDSVGPWAFTTKRAAMACVRRRLAATGCAMLFDLTRGEKLLGTFTD